MDNAPCQWINGDALSATQFFVILCVLICLMEYKERTN